MWIWVFSGSREECGWLSNPANGPLSVLIEAVEKIHLMWVSFMDPSARNRRAPFVFFRKPFRITFFC